MTDIYSILLKRVDQSISDLGWRRLGGKFLFDLPYGNARILFRKSVKTTHAISVFTADFQIVHDKISNTLRDLGFISFCEFQYSQRLGFFLESPEDKWWSISNDSDLDAAHSEVINIINDYVMKKVYSVSSEEDLVSMWISGSSPGLTHVQRICSLMAFYKLNRAKDRFDILVESELGGDISENKKDFIRSAALEFCFG